MRFPRPPSGAPKKWRDDHNPPRRRGPAIREALWSSLMRYSVERVARLACPAVAEGPRRFPRLDKPAVPHPPSMVVPQVSLTPVPGYGILQPCHAQGKRCQEPFSEKCENAPFSGGSAKKVPDTFFGRETHRPEPVAGETPSPVQGMTQSEGVARPARIHSATSISGGQRRRGEAASAALPRRRRA